MNAFFLIIDLLVGLEFYFGYVPTPEEVYAAEAEERRSREDVARYYAAS